MQSGVVGGQRGPKNVVPKDHESDLPVVFPHAAFDVVALAASAGGLTALGRVLAPLPADFPVIIVVV